VAFDNKGIACLFICLLMLDAVSTQGLAAPVKSRKRISVSVPQNLAAQKAKHQALPNKILIKGNGPSCNSNSAAASCSKKTRHSEYSRCYQTVATANVTIDEVVTAQESVDSVVTHNIHLKTLSTHRERWTFLTNTTTERKFLRHVSEIIQTLTTVHRAFKTLVPISVTIDVFTTESVEIGEITSHSALFQRLRESEKSIRVKTTYETERRRVTSTQGVIRAIKRVHENISQSAPRTVTGGKIKSCKKSNSSNSSNHSNNSRSQVCKKNQKKHGKKGK